MKKFTIITFLTFLIQPTFGQNNDSLYSYTIRVHQKYKPCLTYWSGEIIKREGKSPYIMGFILDQHEKPILTSTISLMASENDSLISQVVLDKTNVFNFDNISIRNYRVLISSDGYASTKLINVLSEKDYCFNFKLAKKSMYITTTVKSNKKLSRRQLKNRRRQIEAELNS